MYTSTSTYNKVAPYYSNDCSAFVSWAWKTSSRKTTSTLSSVSTKVATQSIYSMEIGDALVYAGSHTVLVTDVGYDGSGNLAYIDITEQTPPQTKKTRYGAGGSYTLSQLTTKYLNSKYILYRSKTRTSVTYTHICEVPIDGDSCEKCATTTLSTTPTILGLSKSTAGITITWKKITGVEGYYIYRLIPGGSYQKIATLSDSKTSYTDTTVSNNQVYQYLVQGYKGNSTVDDSDIWIDAPTISKAEAKSTGTTLTWTSITGASKYYIYRGTTKLAETTKTSYTDTTATYGTTYSYSVSAVYSFKESEKSVSKSIKSVFIPTLTKPTLKSATIVSSGTTITWSKVTNSAGYYVYRRTPSGSFKKIASVTGTSYTDTTAVKTTAYYYTVQAYAGSVTSTKDETGILRKAKVTVSVSNLSNGIKISWPNVGSKITYKIFRRKSNSEKWGSTAYATTTSTSYTDTKATLTTSYQYGVKAYYGSKLVLDLTYSNYIQHKLVTPTIKTSVSGRKVTISWSKVTGAKGYQIQRKTKSGPWKTIKTTTSLQYTNSLSLAGSYYYRVRAYQVVSNKYYYSAYKTSSLLKIK
jgi:fibronectin type 3 domain-containing protein